MNRRFFLKHFSTYFSGFLIAIFIIGAIAIIAVYNAVLTEVEGRIVHNMNSSSRNISLMLDSANYQQALLTYESNVASSIKDTLESKTLTYKDIGIRDLLKYIVFSPTVLNHYIDSVYIYVPNNRNNFLTSGTLVQNIASTLDNTWYDSYMKKDPDVNVWMEKRVPGTYDFESRREVISIFQRLGFSDGVMVVNILPQEFASQMNQDINISNELALLFNDDGELVFSSARTADENVLDITTYHGLKEGVISEKSINGKNYLIIKKNISKYGLDYYLLSPTNVTYKNIFNVIYICLLAVLIAIVISSFIAFYITNKNSKQLNHIIDAFGLAENGQAIPQKPGQFTNEYDIILNNIINTFINQSYLKLQLKNKQQEYKIAQLTALQLQINPHFVFNTLQTIDFEILEINKKYCDANVLIKKLSNVLTYSLKNSEQLVTIEEEIINTNDYLYIQKFRYKDHLNIIWDCDESVKSDYIICMVLQPFLENSIRHGQDISGKPLSIKISIHPGKDRTKNIFKIIDNGIGIPARRLKALQDSIQENNHDTGNNIGLRNTVMRLRLRFGADFNVKIASKEGLGTLIRFEIPKDFTVDAASMLS